MAQNGQPLMTRRNVHKEFDRFGFQEFLFGAELWRILANNGDVLGMLCDQCMLEEAESPRSVGLNAREMHVVYVAQIKQDLKAAEARKQVLHNPKRVSDTRLNVAQIRCAGHTVNNDGFVCGGDICLKHGQEHTKQTINTLCSPTCRVSRFAKRSEAKSAARGG